MVMVRSVICNGGYALLGPLFTGPGFVTCLKCIEITYRGIVFSKRFEQVLHRGVIRGVTDEHDLVLIHQSTDVVRGPSIREVSTTEIAARQHDIVRRNLRIYFIRFAVQVNDALEIRQAIDPR